MLKSIKYGNGAGREVLINKEYLSYKLLDRKDKADGYYSYSLNIGKQEGDINFKVNDGIVGDGNLHLSGFPITLLSSDDSSIKDLAKYLLEESAEQLKRKEEITRIREESELNSYSIEPELNYCSYPHYVFKVSSENLEGKIGYDMESGKIKILNGDESARRLNNIKKFNDKVWEDISSKIKIESKRLIDTQ